MGANSHSFHATPGHSQLSSVRLDGSASDIKPHAATVNGCLLSLIAAAVALP
jgi:hypothetical protein